MPLILQLVQSLNASGFYSTRLFLASTNCAADAASCAISERVGSFLDPGSPGRHEMCHRCLKYNFRRLENLQQQLRRKSRPVQKKKLKITRPEDVRVLTRRCNDVPTTIHGDAKAAPVTKTTLRATDP